ncbi:hypothetical protein BH10CYA1_BH10CYA1_24070 [soil metagenome]
MRTNYHLHTVIMQTDLDKTPEIQTDAPTTECTVPVDCTLPADCTLPVMAAHEFRLRWNDEAIQFETPTGMRHLAWKDVVVVAVSDEKPGVQLLGRTVDITDRGGAVHKIAIADIPDKTRWLDLIGTIQYCTEAKVVNLDVQLYSDLRDFLVRLWPAGQPDVNHKKTKTIVSAVIILFAVCWTIEFVMVLSSDTQALVTHSFGWWIQCIKFIPLLFLPLYARSAPVSQIRCTPTELRCEAILGGHVSKKKELQWNSIKSVELSAEKPNQRVLDRQLCFNRKKGRPYKLKLEQIGTAANWKELLTAIYCSSGIQVENADPNLFDQINPNQQDPSYTQIWLDSLLAPAHREKLLQLDAGATLQNGKYMLDRKLGAGGQGAAYLARRDDGAMVVLKEYILPIYVDAKVKRKSLENFENEAHMLQQLDSPLIVKLLGFFVEDHRGYLVLEHIKGINLREHVAQNGPLSEKQVVHYGVLMCDVLAHLHSQNPPIVHRDFTPDNIILSGHDSIKVIDFMVAQTSDQSATGTVVGKHAYLPPEQFRGKATTQSDIYALGCSLFFLLTGDEPEPLTTSHPILTSDTVSGALDTIVAKATELESAERYKSAAELKHALLALREPA